MICRLLSVTKLLPDLFCICLVCVCVCANVSVCVCLCFIVGLGDKEAEKKVAVGFNDPWRTRMLLEG